MPKMSLDYRHALIAALRASEDHATQVFVASIGRLPPPKKLMETPLMQDVPAQPLKVTRFGI